MSNQSLKSTALRYQNFLPNVTALGSSHAKFKEYKKIVFFSSVLSVVNLFLIYPIASDIFVSYSLFTLIFSFYIVNTFSKPRSPANLFLCLFLTLGFYVKAFSYMYFDSYSFTEPVGDYFNQSHVLSRVLNLISVAIVAILAVQMLFFKKVKIKSKEFIHPKRISDLKLILLQTTCFILITTVCFLNYYYGIYQKGKLVNFFFEIHKSLMAWGVLFGFSTVIATFPNYFSNTKYRLISFLLILSTMAVTSVSALSSTYIVLALAAVYGFCYTSQKVMPIKYFLIFIFFIGISFIFSIKLVTGLRFKHFSFDSTKIHDVKAVTPNFLETLFTLSTGRWVGLEGVLAGVSYSSDRIAVFNEIANEKPSNLDRTSIYDTKVAKSVYAKNKNKPGIFAMTTPGFIGWVSILDSVPLMFLSVFFAYFVLLFSEYVVFYFTENLIVTAILGQALAFRFVHFGYMPMHTYKIFFGILLSLISTYSIHLLISRNKITWFNYRIFKND